VAGLVPIQRERRTSWVESPPSSNIRAPAAFDDDDDDDDHFLITVSASELASATTEVERYWDGVVASY